MLQTDAQEESWTVAVWDITLNLSWSEEHGVESKSEKPEERAEINDAIPQFRTS